MKKKQMYMVREDGESEYLSLTKEYHDHARVAKPSELSVVGMAEMLDQSAENCNAHDFVGLHKRLGTLIANECSVSVAHQIMRKLVDCEGLYGLNGICGKGDEKENRKLDK